MNEYLNNISAAKKDFSIAAKLYKEQGNQEAYQIVMNSLQKF